MRIGFWPVVAAVVLLLVGGSFLLSQVIGLANDNRDSITRNRATALATKTLACRIGGFLVDAPIVKQPGTSQRIFERQVERAGEFLKALRDQNCGGLGHVTTAKINSQIRTLRRVAPGAVGGDGSGGGQAAPTGPGTASTTKSGATTPDPNPPSAGPSGPQGSPPVPGPPPNPPPTTTTPSPVPRPPVLRPVCRRLPALCKFGLFRR
jgi:hypothetical protein